MSPGWSDPGSRAPAAGNSPATSDRPFGRRGTLFASRARQVGWFVAVVTVLIFAGRAARGEPGLPEFVATGDAVAMPEPGALPAVSLQQFEGMLVGLQGRPVVVNVWASWCAPCRTEMPLLQEAALAFAGQVTILGVASNDDPGSAATFLEEIGVTYPNVFDPSGEIRVALGLSAYPTTYVFGRDGSIRARVDGGISEQRLAGLIEDALR